MSESPCGSAADARRHTAEEGDSSDSLIRSFRSQITCVSRPPTDPVRQERRLPVRILKMLTAHASHMLHPEYLQPLSSAPVSIELDAKKSPLALLAQTCSQIGKPDPPPSSKLSSLSSSSLGDKEGRSASSALKSCEQHQGLEDKSSFKPYSKSGSECRKEGGVANGSVDKVGFRVPGGSSAATTCPTFPPHASSPRTSSPTQNATGQTQAHRQTQTPPMQRTPHAPLSHAEPKSAGSAPSTDGGSGGGNDRTGKKEAEHGKAGIDHAQLANSSQARASVNSSSGSSSSSPRPDSKPEAPPSQPGLATGHVAPVSPFKPSHSVFPLPPSTMGYHGSVVGAYAGYPSQFVSGLDHAKSSLVGGAGMGVPGKHPSSSPLTGSSPPSLMQGLCRDPYCLAYPNAPHLGGGGCLSCVHDPSSSLKSAFPLVYPSPHLHTLHPSSLSSAPPSLAHPLYTYGFVLPSDTLPHACNWVSVAGPCDKRFGTSEELLAHLRTHTALPGVDGKLLSGYPSSAASAASCHLHLPPPSSPGALPSSFSLRGSPGLGLARYHPYSKAHLPGSPTLPMHSLPASSPYHTPYALYSQRLGSASTLGYP